MDVRRTDRADLMFPGSVLKWRPALVSSAPCEAISMETRGVTRHMKSRPCFFVLRRVNTAPAEYESSATQSYKKIQRKKKNERSRAGLASRRTPRMSLLSTSQAADEETGRRGKDAREELKGIAGARAR